MMKTNSEGGFTLVEVMAAITIFTIMTLGLVPLFASSIKGASISRSFTRGKNVAVEAMERARGIPFFIDYPTQQAYASPDVRKVDLLDLYFPAASDVDAGTYSGGTFTTVCTPTTDDPACPRNLPEDYEVSFVAQFVEPVASGSNEEYVVVPPGPSYRWDPDPFTYNREDHPPTQMLRFTVIVEWTYAGDQKAVELSSIIGNRDFGEVTVSGSGKIDHVVQVTTQFTDPSTLQKTEVRGVVGSGESDVETKSQSNAHQTVNAARIFLTRLPLTADGTAEPLPTVEGAASSIHAPPDSSDPSGVSATPRVANIDTFGTVAGMDGTTTSDLRVSVSRELPVAEGSFGFSAPTGTERLFFTDGQVGAESLRLDTTEGLLKFSPRGGTIAGSTAAETTSVGGSSRRVLTSAEASFERLRFLSTTFIQSVITDLLGDSTHRSVVVVDDFRASVECRATGLASTASATKSWSADLYFYVDNNNNGAVDGAYQRVALGSGMSSDPLAQWGRNATNPLVYDGATDAEDIYLFETVDRRGYLQSWSSTVGEAAEVLENGSVTSAAIGEAIRIVSAPTDPVYPDSNLLLQIGKLGCGAQDFR